MERETGAELEQVCAQARDPVIDLPPQVGQERRLHARAYTLWAGLREGGGVPSLAVFRAADHRIFGEYGALLSPASGVASLLGAAIARETGLADGAPLAEIAPDTMLAALVSRLHAVVTHRAPIGFEADYPDTAGRTLYRGILLPLGGPTGAIEHIYAVIGWRRLAGAATADVSAAIGQAFAGPPADVAGSAWEASPRASLGAPPLEQRLAMARTWAALARQASPRRESALAWALSATHDLLIAADTQPAIIGRLHSGVAAGGGAMARAVRLVFDEDEDPRALREYCLALAWARRLGIGIGMLAPAIGRHRGFIDGFIADARARQRPEAEEAVSAASLRLTPLDPALLVPRSRVERNHRRALAQPSARAFG